MAGEFSQQSIHKVHNPSGEDKGRLAEFSKDGFPTIGFVGPVSLAKTAVQQKANAKSKNTFFMCLKDSSLMPTLTAFRRSRPTSFGVVSGFTHSCNL